jgi:hypothetical protein
MFQQILKADGRCVLIHHRPGEAVTQAVNHFGPDPRLPNQLGRHEDLGQRLAQGVNLQQSNQLWKSIHEPTAPNHRLKENEFVWELSSSGAFMLTRFYTLLG